MRRFSLKKMVATVLATSLVVSSMVTGGVVKTANAAESNEKDTAHEAYGHYYKVFNERLSWEKAKQRCEEMGGHLVTITSQQEQSVVDYVNQKGRRLWIGGHRDDKNNWYWITGEEWNYTNWAEGEPNNSSNVISNENSASVWPRKWNDLNERSGEQEGFMCEWDDGSSFAADFKYPYMSPELNGHHYAIFNERLSWDEAMLKCEEMGGHLVTITSQQEQEFVQSKVNGNSRKVWIGGYRDDAFNWYWVTGEKWQYTNWKQGEPNNSRNIISNENRVSMWPWEWNDLNTKSGEQDGYICEWEAEGDEGQVYNVRNADAYKCDVTLKNMGKKRVKVTVNRRNTAKSTKVDGYIVQYSTSKKFSKKNTKSFKIMTSSIKSGSKVTKLVKKLKLGKKYYFRICSIRNRTQNGKAITLYSEWSKVRSIKVKNVKSKKK